MMAGAVGVMAGAVGVMAARLTHPLAELGTAPWKRGIGRERPQGREGAREDKNLCVLASLRPCGLWSLSSGAAELQAHASPGDTQRGRGGGGELLGQGADDLLLVREAALLVLGEDELAVDDDVELADRPGLDLAVDADLFLDRGRETRGAGFVVSGLAVLDRDRVDHGRRVGRARADGKSGRPFPWLSRGPPG
jgi:hypothetical protein